MSKFVEFLNQLTLTEDLTFDQLKQNLTVFSGKVLSEEQTEEALDKIKDIKELTWDSIWEIVQIISKSGDSDYLKFNKEMHQDKLYKYLASD